MKIDNAFQIINPTLHYRLDPGEPGLATPTSASRSIAKVATHEATNIRRFRKEAAEEGGVVLYSYIYLNLQFQGSFLAAVSGKSKALVIVPAEEPKSSENVVIQALKDSTKFENAPEKTKPDSEDVKNAMNSGKSAIAEIANSEVAKIDGTIQKLENDKLLLMGQLGENENVAKDDEESASYNENRLKDIESKIKYLEQKKELEKQKEYFKSILASNDMANKLVGLIYNGSTVNESGNLVDDVA